MTNNFLIHNFKQLTTTPENVEQLKKLVLQMAVQGKLTAKWREEVQTRFIASPELAQSPHYNAHALLQKIKIEKEQLIKEGKIKRQKTLPPIADEEKPFELPTDWVMIRLGNLIRISSGDGLTSSQMDKSGNIPVYGGNGINGYHSDFNIENKHIVIGRVGANCGAIHLTNEKAWVTDNAFITYHSNYIFQDWLYYTLIGLNIRNYARESAQPVISGQRVYPIILGFPSYDEQQAIVSQVEKLFTQIDQLHALAQKRLIYREKSAKALFSKINHAENDTELQGTWQTLTAHFHNLTQSKESVKQLRQSILQMAVQGKLTAKWREENPDVESASILLEKIKAEKEQLIKSGKIKRQKSLPPISPEDKPFELPSNWSYERLGNYTINRDGRRIPLSKKERENRKRIYDYYGASGVIDKVDDFLFDGEYLLIGEDGANLVARSTPIAFIARGKFWVNNHAHVLECLSITSIDYLSTFINAIDLKPFVTGGFQPKLSQGNLNIIPISVPPYEEQKAIVSKVKQLMAWCDELEKKIEKRDAYQEKMIQAVVKQAFKTEKEIVEAE